MEKGAEYACKKSEGKGNAEGSIKGVSPKQD